MTDHETSTSLPDGARVTAELVVLAYLKEDGGNSYVVSAKGDMPMTTYLGLTVLAQEEIKKWREVE